MLEGMGLALMARPLAVVFFLIKVFMHKERCAC